MYTETMPLFPCQKTNECGSKRENSDKGGIMKLDDYIIAISGRLRSAYNSKNWVLAKAVISEAEQSLLAHKIDAEKRKFFWDKVHNQYRLGQILVEKQEGSALHQLMLDIDRELKARAAQAESEK